MEGGINMSAKMCDTNVVEVKSNFAILLKEATSLAFPHVTKGL